MVLQSRFGLSIAFLVIAVVCAALGIWQVRRLQERRAANALALAARLAPMVRLGQETPAGGLVNRRVRASGRYDHARDIVLRGRAHYGVPGVEVVSPLLVDGESTAILVNRGFVPAPDAVTVELDSLQEPGTAVVQGIALRIDSGSGSPLQRGRYTTWARLDLEALRRYLPYDIYPVYIRQQPDSSLPRVPRRLEAPPLNDGPHLSYAIQWFAFGIIAAAFAGVMYRSRAR
jgi:surfeit locus 1 family protein